MLGGFARRTSILDYVQDEGNALLQASTRTIARGSTNTSAPRATSRNS